MVTFSHTCTSSCLTWPENVLKLTGCGTSRRFHTIAQESRSSGKPDEAGPQEENS
jgi:hypothetical protein